MANIGIIGYGIVGEALAYGFGVKNKIRYYDKYKDSASFEDVVKSSEFIFVCVPTPYNEGGIDLSIMDEVVSKISELSEDTDKIIVIKSTVIPGTTRDYAKKYPGIRFCFNPEFLTESNYLEDFVRADRIVIGADDEATGRMVEKLYRDIFKKTHIFVTDSASAELSKYAANTFLGTKVMFGNMIHQICERTDADYEAVKDILASDTRIGRSHLDIDAKHGGGFGGKCFPKDMVAFIEFCKKKGLDCSLLETVWDLNLKIRKIRDWESIPFVKSAKDSQKKLF